MKMTMVVNFLLESLDMRIEIFDRSCSREDKTSAYLPGSFLPGLLFAVSYMWPTRDP